MSLSASNPFINTIFSPVFEGYSATAWQRLAAFVVPNGYAAVGIARTTTLLEHEGGLYSLAATPFPVLPYFEREEPFIWLSFTKRPSSASMN
jgi:hypothetical protein